MQNIKTIDFMFFTGLSIFVVHDILMFHKICISLSDNLNRFCFFFKFCLVLLRNTSIVKDANKE